MASEVVCGLIFRLLLPVCLAAACLFRYNALSFVYLVYLLLIPLFAEPTSTSMQGHTGRLLQSLCFTSMSFLLLHIVYQITVNSLLAGNSISPDFNCSTWEKSIRQIGFESVIGADAGNGIRVFIPDIGMFMVGLAIWLLCRSLVQKRPPEDMAQYNADFDAEEQAGEDEEDEELIGEEGVEAEEEEEEEEKESAKMKVLRIVAEVASKGKEIIGNLITTAGKVVVTILLGMTGVMLPSMTSAVYFFIFLFLCTWWSLCRTFDTLIFSCMCVLMAIYSAGHLIVLYLYQFQFFQESIPPGDSYISVFGISPIVQSNCSYTWMLIVHPDRKWYHFVNPIMLLLLYYTLATLIRLWLQEPIEQLMVRKICCKKDKVTIRNTAFFPKINSTAGQHSRKASYAVDLLIDVLQGLPTSNGTSFEFVTTENGPVCLDLYSTPQYKMDMPSNESVYEVCLPSEDSPQDGEEEKSEESDDGIKQKGVSAMVKAFHFVMKQSYICALIAMMAWSITYVSWLTFAFLIWSCILWMVRDRRRYAMLSSPFMVAYGNLLIVLQYIWSFEDMGEVPGFFVKKRNPFHSLSSKVLCLLSFWLLLRQTLTERWEKQKEDSAGLSDIHVEDQEKKGNPDLLLCFIEEEEETEDRGEQDIMQVLGSMVMALLVKYWIYICGGMFFFVSFEGTIVMYKIIYMMMFLSCVALYQVHYEWWRRMLKYFWMSVVMYTMLVLTLVYTFQFKGSVDFWSNMLGMNKQGLKDLGLEQFTVSQLFTRIFIPTSFLLVCILHLHYFHDRFLQLTDLQAVVAKEQSTIYSHAKVSGRVYLIVDRWVYLLAFCGIHHFPSLPWNIESDLNSLPGCGWVFVFIQMKYCCNCGSTLRLRLFTNVLILKPSLVFLSPSSDLKNKWHLVVDRLTVLFLKFLEYFHKLQLFIWWLLEIHIIKIVACYIVLVSVKEVSLFNFVFLASWAFALPYGQYRPIASSVCTVWTCVIIICKMLYQLKSINPPSAETEFLLVDPANWVGLDKSVDLLGYLRNNLLMLAILAFEVTIYRHQEYFRLRNKLSPPAARIIFHDITRQHLDIGIISFIKYFINYFFYKFGLETCLLLVVNVIGQRMDFYAMLHALALIVVMYRRRRKAIAEIWPKYCCFLACMLTFQYFVCIGIPPAACKEYPWRFPSSFTDSNVVKWLYLPDFHTRPSPSFLIYDFMLLLCASLQRQVFEDENKAAVRIMAGDNVEICRDLDAASFSVHNPVPDFIHCRSYLDMLKVIMFSYLFWFVLTIIFITGTTRISVFCMGYLVACFYFLLFGGDLLLKPIKKILHYWDFLIAYNIFVITMKNILSILACGYINSLIEKQCWLIQLLSLACTIKEYDINTNQDQLPADQHCDLPSDEAGIIWDSICFAFLLLQRRVFMSYYFLHVVADIRASQILASRGAELFQATIVKAVRARLEEERKSVEQLKRQMERIKVRQQKFKRGKEKMLSMAQESGDGQMLVQPDDDDDDAQRTKPKTKKKQWWRPWVDHASMVRSGDYYLFETDSEEEEEEEDKKEEEPPRKSAFQQAMLGLNNDILFFLLSNFWSHYFFLYHAWITDPKAALKARGKEKRKFWRRYTRGVRQRKNKKEDNIIKRVFNIIKFTWVLFQTTVDSFTKWMNEMCREYVDISTVLRIERCMLTREVKKGNVPSRESIHVYYQKAMRLNMSRQASMDQLSEDESYCGSSRVRRRRAGFRMESQDSTASRDSMSSAVTEATTLFSRQSTLEDLDGMSENIPKTSERARPKLRKMYSLDMSNSSAESGSSVISSEATQCITLYSRQGTTETIEEVEDEQDQVEDKHRVLWESQELEDSEEPEEAEVKEGRAGLLYTPDTDASKTSDAEVPPSYSKAVSFDRLEVSDDESDNDRKRRMIMTSDSHSDSRSDIVLPSMTTELTASDLLLNKMFYDEELEQSDKFYLGQPLILQLCYALYNMLVAHSEMVCYLVIIINHMVSASCATLVLPITIFLWAMLSVPRPSKRYWMTAIVYTEVTIVVKYFFQFGFFPFNQSKIDKSKPYHPPNIIGVEKKDGYVHYDLVQLLALFFHRSILKCHGLWDEDDPKEKKEPVHHSESEDEENDQEESGRESEPASSLLSERRGSNQTLRSNNFGTSIDSGQILVHQPQQQTYQRRRSSSGASHISSHKSLHSSARSKRGNDHLSLKCTKIKVHGIFRPYRFMEIYIPIRQFFYNLIHPEYSAVTDVYVLMFLADTVDFIIIVFGFWAFGKHSAADITSSLSEDQVPGPFLVMVLIQFGTMVVDRALYLRKSVMGKVIFQVILVFGIHFWMFFILPGVTQKRFIENRVAQMWYFVKCIYFGLSAYQIRCGYPTRVLGNFLTKSYNYVNLFLFQGFRLVPFLTELRAVMDWVWTDTSLSLSSWICVEDIYAHIFILKCWRESEKRYPQPRGQKKKKVVKYGMGGIIVVLLICIVWFPLLFMSLVKSVAGVVTPPLDVSFEITLAGFQPIFTMSAQQKQLQTITTPEYKKFNNKYFGNDDAMQWLEGYMAEDLIIAELKGSSNSLWTISPPSRTNLIEMLSSAEDFPITVAWSVQRNLSRGAKAETASGKRVTPLDQSTKLDLITLLNGTGSRSTLTNIFPRYIRAPSDSDNLKITPFDSVDEKMMDINLTLMRAQNISEHIQEWWIVNQTELGPIEKRSPKYKYEAGLEVYVFSDQVSPPSLGFLAGYGIMGLYASVVLVIGKFVREFFSGISHTIMFEELPNVDRILKLCTDIFLVRETGELDLEEDMYAKLIFLYRSPETMIKWTREKTQ
uniref:Piezo type mechanosensitive ion channel component 2 n=1 Tax=Cynoglossus semilaevis TaxID=244447 RepID=A0A3P8WGM9_CYNSE